jgi:hypothetical protein
MQNSLREACSVHSDAPTFADEGVSEGVFFKGMRGPDEGSLDHSHIEGSSRLVRARLCARLC